MFPPRKRLLTLLTIICLALAPSAATASPLHHASKRVVHAHVGCVGRSAKVHHRAHATVHGCRASARKAHKARQVKAPRKTHKHDVQTKTATHATLGQESAAKIAEVLATPCENTELTPAAGNTALVRAAVLCLVNQERARNGRSPLIANSQLENAAEGHCTELITDDYFAHVSPSGETPVQRIVATGYVPSSTDGYAIGENLAWGTLGLSTPKAIVAAWLASPGHLANILESQYTETGIGVTPAVPASLSEGEPGASYAQEFGVVIS